MPETRLPSSTDTSGKAATLRFAKTASLVTLASVAEDVVASERPVAVLGEALALVAALAVAVPSAAAAAASEVVEVLAEAAMAVLLEVVSTPTVLRTLRTPSPTSLRQVVSPAT